MSSPAALPLLPCAPWRLSGLVVGVLMNDPAALAALGDAVHQPLYKAAPKAPVLFIKPPNTLNASSSFTLPEGVDEVELGAHVGLVIGRTACRVSAAEAPAHIAALLAVADLSLPHASFYRPALRCKALDGSCLLGAAVPAGVLSFAIEVKVDERSVQQAHTSRFLRSPAQLLADVSQFMTLRPGDVLLLGAAHGASRLRAGMSARVALGDLPPLSFEVRR